VTRFHRLLACAALVLGVLTALCFFQPRWLPGGGNDSSSVPAAASRYAEQLERGEVLHTAREDVMDRIDARERVVRDVIGRRLSLAQAAARFQELDLASPTFNWKRFRADTPGATDEEKQCRAVIRRVCTTLAEDPGRARAEARRLEEELGELLSRGGPRQGGSPPTGERAVTVAGTPRGGPRTGKR
jgi:hypothetical protein